MRAYHGTRQNGHSTLIPSSSSLSLVQLASTIYRPQSPLYHMVGDANLVVHRLLRELAIPYAKERGRERERESERNS